jgi:hypothetical protein
VYWAPLNETTDPPGYVPLAVHAGAVHEVVEASTPASAPTVPAPTHEHAFIEKISSICAPSSGV